MADADEEEDVEVIYEDALEIDEIQQIYQKEEAQLTIIYFYYSQQQWYTASQQFNKKILALKHITTNK